MVDLKLKKLSIRNWMKFEDVTLDFPAHGLVLVQGINTASGGALASVGSGKTGIGEALCRTLLGVRGRFEHMKKYSRDKNGDSYVVLTADFKGKPLIVESGYQCKEMNPNSEALRYCFDGKTVERGEMSQTRADLSRLLGVSRELAEWTVFVDGEHLKFNKLGQENCVNLVMGALRQPPWTAYFEAAKSKSGQFKRDMARTQRDHALALESVNEAQTEVKDAKEVLEDEQTMYERRLVAFKERRDTLKKKASDDAVKAAQHKKRMQEIANTLKRMEEERAALAHQLEIRVNEINDEIVELEVKERPLLESKEQAFGAYVEAKSDRSNYAKAGDKCPTCQRPMGIIDQNRLDELIAKQEASHRAYTAKSEAVQNIGEKIDKLKKQKEEANKKLKTASNSETVKELSEEHEDLEKLVITLVEQIHATELQIAQSADAPAKDKIVEAKAYLKSATEKLATAQEFLEKKAASLTEDMEMAKVLEYWNMAFSPYGIPNMVLRDAIGPLNKEARRISSAMTGGTIEIRYSTTREMASGLEKAQLNIEVDNKLGDKDLLGSSKGESGLTNIIVSETLSEVGQVSRRIGFRWYDEVIPHQDSKVCQSIYSYMKDIAQQLGILIFLVDHNPVAANYADHILMVEKKVKANEVVSTARWR